MFLLVACFWNSEALSSFQTYIKRQISQFFGQIYKAHKPYLPLTHTYTQAHRGWPTACCLLCTAYLGISLMQGDAMKEQSDANPAV